MDLFTTCFRIDIDIYSILGLVGLNTRVIESFILNSEFIVQHFTIVVVLILSIYYSTVQLRCALPTLVTLDLRTVKQP